MRRFVFGFLAGFACLFSALSVLAIYLWHRPPLLRVPRLVARYSISGISFPDGTVYRSPFVGTCYYVHLPSIPEARYRWFAFDIGYRTVGSPGDPYDTPFGPSTPHLPSLGIQLTDNKIEDRWQVDFTGPLPHFSNGTIDAQVLPFIPQ